MPSQILLQGRLAGTEQFLLSPPADRDYRAFESRLTWLALVEDVLPRALLRSLNLPDLMLGAAGEQFLLILPDEARAAQAQEFLTRAGESMLAATDRTVSVIWSATENLGDWTVVRKRLQDGMAQTAAISPDFFEPFVPAGSPPQDSSPRGLRDAKSVAFDFGFPALIAPEDGAPKIEPHQMRHAARNGDAIASPKELAKRAKGRRLWGVLRGEIDDLPVRMRRLQSVEEFVQYSTLYRQFLAGEIELLCSQGEYFQRVTVLRTGTGDFALMGAWDALLGFARELQRVFALFAQEHLKDLPGAEAKTITMSLTVAEPGEAPGRVWEESRRELEAAQQQDKDCFQMLGRVLEWKQMNDAAELKDAVVQIGEDFRGGGRFLEQLRSLYRKVESPDGIDRERLTARALRFQRRFANVANRREREFQKLRSHLMKEMAGRNMRGPLKLRPEGLVALEWARLAED